jgi:hypothetical protein
MQSQASAQAQPHQAVVGREKYRSSRFHHLTTPGPTGRMIALAWLSCGSTVGRDVRGEGLNLESEKLTN